MYSGDWVEWSKTQINAMSHVEYAYGILHDSAGVNLRISPLAGVF